MRVLISSSRRVLSLEAMGCHVADVGERVFAEFPADELELRRMRVVNIERVIAEPQHFARREMPRR